MQPMQWDLYCRVIDNHGDVGVCWRLSADLAARGETVRLWIDDASALRWMAPDGALGVDVRRWPVDEACAEPGDVVIEAFGCELPAACLQRMAAAKRAPVWINLEYLSAEGYAERAHGLPSPQLAGPTAGSRKWFYYPGFTARTGGLIREADLLACQQAFDTHAWRSTHGASTSADERIVSLFCYEPPALPALLEQLSREPTLLLATAGHAARQVEALLGASLRRNALRALLLPPLTQRDYDHLLWASDLNFVRGEDSLVRAQWAGKPFVWQIYPQHDGVHGAKLDAFLARFLAGAPSPSAGEVAAFWQAWNSAAPELPALPDAARWRGLCEAWRSSLLAHADLCSQLLGFVAERR